MGNGVDDCMSRQAATTIPVMPKEHRHYQTNNLDDAYEQGWNDLQECIESLPPVAEPLTDAEQRIFLAAMVKERAVCKKLTDEWDGMKLDVPCPVNLLRLCAEVERKVKAALWTN